MRTAPTATQLRFLAEVFTAAVENGATVDKALKVVFRQELGPTHPEEVARIVGAVADHFDVDVDEIFEVSNRPGSVQLRRVAMRLMRLAGIEYHRIGAIFRQHRAAAYYSCEMADQIPQLQRVVRELASQLGITPPEVT